VKRRQAWYLLLLVPIVACAELGKTLEKVTGEDTVEGKLVRGANKLRKSYQDLDPSEEHYIGRSVGAQILGMPQYPLDANEALLAYVERVGHGIVETNDGVLHPFLDYRFGILDTDEVNAFACPGGLILLTRGLVTTTHGEDELAAVLAHEIAHVTLRHGVAAIQKANLTEAFTYLGSGAAQATMKQEDVAKLNKVFDDSVGDVVKTLVTSGYSRDFELAADALGRKFLAGAGYDPQALGRLLGSMHGNGGMLATHPAPKERIDALGAPLAFAGDPEAVSRQNARHAAALGR